MTVTQYVGARYVPLFEGEWDNTKVYEPLTVVQYQGNSFTSRQAVPVGIDINDTNYWAATGTYNAQVEAYRQEVRSFDDRITANADAIEDEEEARALAVSAEAQARSQADSTLQDNIDAEALARAAADTTLQDNIDAEALARAAADTTLQNTKEDIKDYIAVIGDSFSTSNTYDYWPTLLQNKMGYSIIKEATNSSGFTVAGDGGASTFVQQLARLASNANWSKVKYLIVYGGCNDFQSGVSISNTLDAINAFYTAYNALTYKPEIIMAFCNIGYAQDSRWNGFLEWYTAIFQAMQERGYAGLVQNVPYWHFNTVSKFNSDNVHPNSAGQNIIANYFSQIIDGTYTGVQRVQWYRGVTVDNVSYGSQNTIYFNNGLVHVSVRLHDNVPISNIQANSFIGLGDITLGASQLSLMFGTDSQDVPNIWVYDTPVLAGTTGSEIGLVRPMFNAANHRLYFQMFGSASWISGGGFTTANDLQMNFTIYPNAWIL